VLSEQHLTHLESVCQTVESGGRQCGVRITPDELRQLIAAGRIANAATRVDREERDGGKRAYRVNGNLIPADAGIDRADWNLARALARYTQP
jgi:hypothetical protein